MRGRMEHGMAPSTRPFGRGGVQNERGDENRAIGGVPECRFVLEDELSANEVCFENNKSVLRFRTGQVDLKFSSLRYISY